MNNTIRFLLVAVAFAWLCTAVVGGTRFGLEAARIERGALIDQTLQSQEVVDQLRDEALVNAKAAAPEMTELVGPLLDEALTQLIASQPVVRRLVAAEVDRRLGLGHEAISITGADLPDDAQTWLGRLNVDFAVELVPASESAGGLIELLDGALLVLAVLTIAVHMAVARWVSRSAAAFAGCVGAGAALVVLTAGLASSSLIGDPLQRAVVATAIPQQGLIVSAILLALVVGRTVLAHLGGLPYGALSPARFGLSGGDAFDYGDE